MKVLASCPFCYGDDDSLPKAPIVAMGTQVYLSCTLTEELVEGHCLIVPIAHHLSTLSGEDTMWDEVRVRVRGTLHLKLPTTDFNSLVEFYEVSHANVRRGGQRCRFLRDSPVS